MLTQVVGRRGRAEKEPRISIPVPAVPVSELLAGKSQRICNSLNWFKGVTFTFWIKIYRKNIFPKINSKIYKFSGFFLPEVPIPAMPEPESKFLVPSLLAEGNLARDSHDGRVFPSKNAHRWMAKCVWSRAHFEDEKLHFSENFPALCTEPSIRNLWY